MGTSRYSCSVATGLKTEHELRGEGPVYLRRHIPAARHSLSFVQECYASPRNGRGSVQGQRKRIENGNRIAGLLFYFCETSNFWRKPLSHTRYSGFFCQKLVDRIYLNCLLLIIRIKYHCQTQILSNNLIYNTQNQVSREIFARRYFCALD